MLKLHKAAVGYSQTVRQTRAVSEEELLKESLPRLQAIQREVLRQ